MGLASSRRYRRVLARLSAVDPVVYRPVVARGSFAGMRTRTRRRVDVVLVALGVVVAGGAAAVGALSGDGERVAALWVGARVGEDGRARSSR